MSFIIAKVDTIKEAEALRLADKTGDTTYQPYNRSFDGKIVVFSDKGRRAVIKKTNAL